MKTLARSIVTGFGTGFGAFLGVGVAATLAGAVSYKLSQTGLKKFGDDLENWLREKAESAESDQSKGS